MSDFVDNAVPDCLVFKFEEFESATGERDTTLYVLYDIRAETFVIRGKRRDTHIFNSNVYSFECKAVSFLADFIQYLICETNVVNEILYNHRNLPNNVNNITFELLEKHCTVENELSGYNKLQYINKSKTKRRLMNRLRMLKFIGNEY